MLTQIDPVNGKITKTLLGVKHCKDGPAVIYPDGSEEWWYNGKLHRNGDKPAITRKYGIKSWFLNGELHRENGPAVECFGGTKEWYRHGKFHRDDGPAIEVGELHWMYNNWYYQVGGVPSDYSPGTKLWFKNDFLHRDYGYPAVEEANGKREWFVNGDQHLRGEIGSIVIAMLPLGLPPYILLWIFQWSHPEINTLNQPKLVALIEGLRNSGGKLKKIETYS